MAHLSIAELTHSRLNPAPNPRDSGVIDDIAAVLRSQAWGESHRRPLDVLDLIAAIVQRSGRIVQ